jgi:hypothetical protein
MRRDAIVPSADKTTAAHLPQFCCRLATSREGMWFLFIPSAGCPELNYNSLQVRRRVGHGGRVHGGSRLPAVQLSPTSPLPTSFVQTAEIAQYEFLTILPNSVVQLLRFASRKVKPDIGSPSPLHIERIQHDCPT